MLDPNKLLETNDAHTWAREFCRINGKDLRPGIDWEGVMIGWFANAFAAQEMKDRRNA